MHVKMHRGLHVNCPTLTQIEVAGRFLADLPWLQILWRCSSALLEFCAYSRTDGAVSIGDPQGLEDVCKGIGNEMGSTNLNKERKKKQDVVSCRVDTWSMHCAIAFKTVHALFTYSVTVTARKIWRLFAWACVKAKWSNSLHCTVKLKS